MNARAHVTFSGRVQGVFFRANAAEKARAQGVCGWVCNRKDGTVEAVFEGEEEAVRSTIEWCRESQPHARVDDVNIMWEEFTGEFQGFEIRF